MMFYVGCPAWGVKEWVGNFFPSQTPASAFLRIYSRRFNTVEGNTTFYAVPSAETVARWVQETPPTFRLCPKVARAISHAGTLEQHRDETTAFIERLQGLGERLGPMFLQLPPAFSPAQLPHLETFLHFWPQDVRLAVEVRHPDFYRESQAAFLDDLLRRHSVARVMMDTRPIRSGSTEEQRLLQARERKPDLPLHIAATSDIVFLRYIGHPRMEVNEPLLDEWARRLAAWLKEGLTVYAFCHCPFEEHSPTLCVDLYQRVGSLVPLPPLSWRSDSTASELKQPHLF